MSSPLKIDYESIPNQANKMKKYMPKKNMNQ